MKIKRLVIENFKSIERTELVEPNPFTVFVGPNGSGKSNIFEALEFVNVAAKAPGDSADGLFGGEKSYSHRRFDGSIYTGVRIEVTFVKEIFALLKSNSFNLDRPNNILTTRSHYKVQSFDLEKSERPFHSGGNIIYSKNYPQFISSYLRLFINNTKSQRLNYQDDAQLTFSASNLEKVLRRVLTNKTLKDEIFDWLELFIPSFKAVKISDRDELHWFEKATPNYFTKDLISDGTYNILALLTAVYQSKKPQFLCIEEPENGLNPKVVKELVNLCRYACEEFGHFIWLNTHSQTLVSQLTPEEIVLVDKKEGATQTKQIKGMNLHDLPMDEAWLSNALGGGLPW